MSADLHELAAPYALDALDDDEREQFERHLAECERCTVQLADLREAAGALAFAADGPEPPPALRDRIVESARTESGKVVAFPRRRWALPAVATVAAAAACLAVGLGIWADSLSRSLDRERSANESYAQALAFLGEGAEVTALADGKGSLIVSRTGGEAALVVCGLSSAPAGQTYEAWVIEGKVPRPAGLFKGSSACRPVFLEQTVSPGAVVAVTLERKGGAPAPTGAILVQSEAA